MVTDKQVRRLFAMKNKVKYLYQLADTAGNQQSAVLKVGDDLQRPYDHSGGYRSAGAP